MTTASTPRPDAELVLASLEGHQEAFAELYDRYFSSIYDFARRTTRNAEEASDITQDTFVQAMESLGQLKTPGSFKSWLFTIAHRLALRRIERGRRVNSAPPVSLEDGDESIVDPLLGLIDEDKTGSPEEVAEATDLAGLVWEAAASLDSRQYTLLDLHVRRGLDSGEIAEVLGVSKGNASTMLNRMRSAVDDAIGSFVLARVGSRHCDELRQIVGVARIPPVPSELRRTIERHTRRCEVCTSTRRKMLSPVELFGALVPVPIPLALHGEIWSALSRQWPKPAHSSEGGGTGPPSSSGNSMEPHWFRRRQTLALVAAGTVFLLIAGLALVLLAPDGESEPSPSRQVLLGPGATTTAVALLRSGPIPRSTSTIASPTSTATPSIAARVVLPTPSRITQVAPNPSVASTTTSAPATTSTASPALSATSLPPPTLTPSPVPTATLSPTATATLTATETPAITITPDPTASATPTSTSTLTPTSTPIPDTSPPQIQSISSSADPLGTNISDPCPIDMATISAQVSDPSGIASVVLFFSSPGLSDAKAMTGSGSSYTAVIGPLTTPPGQLVYRVEAIDGEANLAVSVNQNITLSACVS